MKAQVEIKCGRWDSVCPPALIPRKLLIPRTAQDARVAETAVVRYTAGTRAVLSVLVLASLSPLVLAQESRTFAVPFHTVNSMVLLNGQLNGKPVTLLLDTGANNTIVSPQAAGLSNAQLAELRATATGTGAEGDAIVREVRLTLEHRDWLNRRVLVMNLDDASKRMGARIDGFIGQDVLRTFSAVRIDYRGQVVTLEE